MRQLLRAKTNATTCLVAPPANDLESRIYWQPRPLHGNDPLSPGSGSATSAGLMRTRLIIPDEIFDIQEQGTRVCTRLK